MPRAGCQGDLVVEESGEAGETNKSGELTAPGCNGTVSRQVETGEISVRDQDCCRPGRETAVMMRPQMITVQPPSEMQEETGQELVIPELGKCSDLTTHYLTFREKYFYNVTESTTNFTVDPSDKTDYKQKVQFPQCSCFSIFTRINRKLKIK